MNKRDVILGLADASRSLPYVPAAFFLHFPAAFHFGQAAVDKHLEYFRYTGMDFVKIQYELDFGTLGCFGPNYMYDSHSFRLYNSGDVPKSR